MDPLVRFDDLSQGVERAFVLTGLRDIVVARRIDEVGPALEAVEEATQGGMWAGGYIAYEAAPAFDPALTVRATDPEDAFHHVPLLWFGVFESSEVVAPLEPRSVHPPQYTLAGWNPGEDWEQHSQAVRRIRKHIAKGNTDQVIHTFQLRAGFSGDAEELYRDLALSQRGGYCAFLDTGRYKVVSASPERFFAIDDRKIIVKPMKGTIRRGRWPEEDEELSGQLASSTKEREENLIIVDLLRDDLDRIADFGTVKVDELLRLERYETLWQLTSEISATLAPDTSVAQVFGALFPSAAITGAPKVPTMELISRLEHSPRGVYCGAIGYLSPAGSGAPQADFNVAIRTVVLNLEEGVASYGTGGGITSDSVSASEYDEALLKAKLLVERRPEFDLIEAIRWDPGQGYWLLEEHLDRIEASAAYFGISFERDAATAALMATAKSLSRSSIVRLLVGRTIGHVVEVLDDEPSPFQHGSTPDTPAATVAVDEAPVFSQNVFLFHRTTRRKVYETRRNRQAHADDVLLTNERGEVTESTTSNVVVRTGEKWWTPPLDSGLLRGVYRRILIDKGMIRERPISVHELQTADEIALVDSLRGWRKVRLVEASD